MDAAQQVLGGDSGQGRPTRHQAFDAQAYRITVSVLPRFESQTLISQSTRADETHRSFDRQFNPTVQNHFLSVNSRSPRSQADRTSAREKEFQVLGRRPVCSDFMSIGGAFCLMATRQLLEMPKRGKMPAQQSGASDQTLKRTPIDESSLTLSIGKKF